MKRYCKILDDKSGLVKLGAGCSDEYYILIGMVEREVEQSDIDLQYYLKEKCPHKTEEQKKQENKQLYINEIKQQLSDIDIKSQRSTRAILTDNFTEQDKQYLLELESKAQELREELRGLING